MADFDVSLRFGIDYRRDGAREIVRDIETLKRAAERLGRDATGRGFGDGLDKAAKSAEKARQEVDKLAQSDDRLRQANGTEALSRNVQRLAGTFERTEQRAADLRAAVDRLKTAEGAAVLTGDIRRIEQVSEASRRKLDALRGAAAQLGDTAGAKDLREAIDRLSGTADKSETAIKGIGDAVRQLGRENGVDTLRQDLDQAETSARRVEDRLHRVERAGQRLGGGGRSRFAGGGRDFAEEAFDQSGATAILPFLRGPAVAAGAVAGGVVYGAFGAGRQAMQLETAMASVRRQAPKGANLSALESGIVKLSVDMGVPKEEIAALVANAMKTNVAYGDLLPFAQNAAQFAVAGEMSMGEAGGTLSLLRDQFKIKQGQVPELLDRVNYLADKSSTNEKDVLNFMARASSSVDIANLKPEQFAAIGTTFLNVGTAPEVAGTGFNALMGALGNAGDKSRKNKDFRRALSKLGLNGRDLQERFYGDTAGTILDFFSRVDQMPQSEKLGILTDIGGQEYGDDFARGAGQVGKMREFLADSASPDAKGSVAAAYAIYNDTTARQMARAGAALEAAGAEIGKYFLPAVRDFAEAVARFVGAWVERRRDDSAVERAAKAAADGTAMSPEDAARFESREGADHDRRARIIDRLGSGKVKATKDVAGVVSDEIAQREQEIAELERRLASRPKSRAAAPGEDVYDPEAENLKLEINRLRSSIEDLTRQLRDATAPAKADKVGYFGDGNGQARLINASLGGGSGGGGSAYRGTYSGGPVMDGFTTANPGSNRGGAAAYGGNRNGSGRALGNAAPLLDLIGRSEGTDRGDGYNETLGYGAFTGGDVDLTGMSLDQVDALQTQMLNHTANGMNSSAVGRYQIVRTTLRKMRNKLGLSGDQKFDEGMQDMLATELARGRGLDRYLAGDLSEDQFLDNLSKEWASLPNRNGRGNYRGQHASVSTGDVRSALLGIRDGQDGTDGKRGAVPRHFDTSGVSVGYANQGATRRREVTDNLMANLKEGIAAVYGPGFRGEIYSGGRIVDVEIDLVVFEGAPS